MLYEDLVDANIDITTLTQDGSAHELDLSGYITETTTHKILVLNLDCTFDNQTENPHQDYLEFLKHNGSGTKGVMSEVFLIPALCSAQNTRFQGLLYIGKDDSIDYAISEITEDITKAGTLTIVGYFKWT